jgi:hypothetical protein
MRGAAFRTIVVGGHAPILLDERKGDLHQRWNEGCTSVLTLFQDIQYLGYRGSYGTMREYLAYAVAPVCKTVAQASLVRIQHLPRPARMPTDLQRRGDQDR